MSVVVAFEVLLNNVDCVEPDRTVTLLKNYKANSKQIYLIMNVTNADLFFDTFLKPFLYNQNQNPVPKTATTFIKKSKFQSLSANFMKEHRFKYFPFSSTVFE